MLFVGMLQFDNMITWNIAVGLQYN